MAILNGADETRDFIRVHYYFLKTDEGGRKTAIHGDYRPNARIADTSPMEMQYQTWLVEGSVTIAPGDTYEGDWILPFSDRYPYAPLQPGVDIELMEGQRVVARGKVVSRFQGSLAEYRRRLAGETAP